MFITETFKKTNQNKKTSKHWNPLLCEFEGQFQTLQRHSVVIYGLFLTLVYVVCFHCLSVVLSPVGYVVLEDNSPLSSSLEDKNLPETLFRTLSAENHGTTNRPLSEILHSFKNIYTYIFLCFHLKLWTPTEIKYCICTQVYASNKFEFLRPI